MAGLNRTLASQKNECVWQGKTLLHYQLHDCIGEGGFGQVFVAWDTKLRRKVAIKKLKMQTAKNPLLNEARFAASMHHPSFVKIFSIETDGTTHFIVMELIEGVTLQERIRKNNLCVEEALRIFGEIADAISFAHEQNLIHGDLKPSNIICESSGTVRILDFGLARRLESEDTAPLSSYEPMGTLSYCAPELMRGSSPSPESDLFSMGIILYQLISFKKPFPNLTGLSLVSAYLQHSATDWNWPQNTPTAVINCVTALTHANPSQRRNSFASQKNLDIEPIANGKVAALIAPLCKHARLLRHFAVALTIGIGIGVGAISLLVNPSMDSEISYISEASAMEKGLRALELYDRPGQLDIAQNTFSKVTEQNPNHAGAIAGLAIVHSYRYASDLQDQTWLRKAQAGAQMALAINPQLSLSLVASAMTLSQEGKLNEAVGRIEQAVSLDPTNVLALKVKGDLLVTSGKFSEASAFAKANLERYPLERMFADLIGTAEFGLGNLSAAEAAFRRSISIEHDAVFSYANLNATLMAQGREEEALQVLQTGLSIRSSAQLFGNLGNTLFMRNDFMGAADAFRNQVSEKLGNPQDHDGWMNLGDILRLIPGQGSEARGALLKALFLIEKKLLMNPNNAALLSKWSLISAKTERNLSKNKPKVEQVVSAAVLAIQAAPHDAQVRMDVAVAHELIGNRQTALQEILASVELGYPIAFIEANPDLTHLRRDPVYQSMLNSYLGLR